MAKRLRLLIPLALTKITDSRGTGVQDSFSILQRIFKGSIDKIVDSLIPIVTRVPVKYNPDDPFDFEGV